MDCFSENALHVVLTPNLKYWLKTLLSMLAQGRALLGHQFVQTSVTAVWLKVQREFSLLLKLPNSTDCPHLRISLIAEG